MRNKVSTGQCDRKRPRVLEVKRRTARRGPQRKPLQWRAARPPQPPKQRSALRSSPALVPWQHLLVLAVQMVQAHPRRLQVGESDLHSCLLPCHLVPCLLCSAVPELQAGAKPRSPCTAVLNLQAVSLKACKHWRRQPLVVMRTNTNSYTCCAFHIPLLSPFHYMNSQHGPCRLFSS